MKIKLIIITTNNSKLLLLIGAMTLIYSLDSIPTLNLKQEI